MLKARTNHASSALNGEIYVIGGKAALPTTPRLPPAPQRPLSTSLQPGGLAILQQWLPTPIPSLGTREPPCWPQGRQGHCLQELTVWGKQDPRQGFRAGWAAEFPPGWCHLDILE